MVQSGKIVNDRNACPGPVVRFHSRPQADPWLLVTPTMRRADRVQSHFCGTSAQAILKNLGWRFCTMSKLVYGMNQSLDGYVDHLEFRPSPALFRHFIEQVRDLTGKCVRTPHVRGNALLGRRLPGLGRGGTRLRGGVAEPAEVGCVAHVEVGRTQRVTVKRFV